MSAVHEAREENVSAWRQGQSGKATAFDAGVLGTNTIRRVRAVWNGMMLWCQKRSTRRVLRDLTDAELLDIGVSRADAGKEVAKSFFWD